MIVLINIAMQSAASFTGERCFRLRQYYLVLGTVATLFFLAMGVGSAAAAYWNVDGSFPRPKLAALVFGAFWCGPALLGAWIISCYFCCRLFVSNTTITDVGCVRTTTIRLGDVVHVLWRAVPRSVVLRTAERKIKIDFNNFTQREQRELIDFVKRRFDETTQEGWPKFSQTYFEPKREPKPFSRTFQWLVVFLLLFFAILFLYCWWIRLGARFLVTAVVNAVAGLLYVWLMLGRDSNRPPSGRSNERDRQSPSP